VTIFRLVPSPDGTFPALSMSANAISATQQHRTLCREFFLAAPAIFWNGRGIPNPAGGRGHIREVVLIYVVGGGWVCVSKDVLEKLEVAQE